MTDPVSKADEERAKLHMLLDRKSVGQVPMDFSKERIDKFYPEFWDTGELRPNLKLVK